MRLLIGGAGGHSRVVADTALTTGDFTEIALVDDAIVDRTYESAGEESAIWSVVGTLADLPRLATDYPAFLAACGDSELRLRWLNEAQALGYLLPVLIHPSATVSTHASLGEGTVVTAGAVINFGARLGRGCIVNTGATVDHDCELGHGVHVCPGAHLAGEVRVGDRSWLGIGAVIRQQITVGANAVVGAGAVCVSDVDEGSMVTGVPAKEHSR